MHICTVIVHRVNDFFILFFSLLSLPLTHLTLFFSFPFSSINSLVDPRCRPKPHRRSVSCWVFFFFFFFWFFPIANLLVSGYFSVVVGYFYWVVWVPIGYWCWSCCTMAFDWLLVSILCGFRFSDGGYVVVWVVLGLWVMTVCGLCWVCERDDTVKEMNILFE